jgi:hypothetical protein
LRGCARGAERLQLSLPGKPLPGGITSIPSALARLRGDAGDR